MSISQPAGIAKARTAQNKQRNVIYQIPTRKLNFDTETDRQLNIQICLAWPYFYLWQWLHNNVIHSNENSQGSAYTLEINEVSEAETINVSTTKICLLYFQSYLITITRKLFWFCKSFTSPKRN